MFDQSQRFQIARRFEFPDQGEALRFVRHLVDLRQDLGGDYELDLTGATLRSASPPHRSKLKAAPRLCVGWNVGTSARRPGSDGKSDPEPFRQSSYAHANSCAYNGRNPYLDL